MCPQCKSTGFATAYHRETNYLYAFRCNCDRGNKWSEGIPRWQNSYTRNFKADWMTDPKKPVVQDYKIKKADPKPDFDPEDVPW